MQQKNASYLFVRLDSNVYAVIAWGAKEYPRNPYKLVRIFKNS